MNPIVGTVNLKGMQIEMANRQLDVQVWCSGERPRLGIEGQEFSAHGWQLQPPRMGSPGQCKEREEKKAKCRTLGTTNTEGPSE